MPHPKPTPGLLLRRLLWPAAVIAGAALFAGAWETMAPALGIPPSSTATRGGRMVALAVVWLAAAWGVIRVLDVVVWRGIVERRAGVPVPRLLSDLVAGLIWLVAVIVVLAYVFMLPVAALVTTSGVAIAIIGFALRDMIASLFAGVALNLERPYQIGDWIEVEGSGVGQVLEVGWLTTRAVTRDGIGIVIPNAKLAAAPFRNYSQPAAAWRDSIAITLDYQLAGERVERILLAAMDAVPQVAAQRQRPDVKIERVDEWGVRWLARYWVSDYGAMPETRYAVQRSVLHHLHHAGIVIPYPRHDLFLARMPERGLDHRRHLDALLARNEVFADLSEDELRRLAAAARPHVCRAGVPIVRAGDEGASLFVVVEGLLRVLRPLPEGGEVEVDRMAPGSAFGEFSLLTGAPRSATVVPLGEAVIYEITKEDLAPILQAHPELAERLSGILAQRQKRRPTRRGRDGEGAGRPPPAAHVWLERVRTFFGLGAEAGPP